MNFDLSELIKYLVKLCQNWRCKNGKHLLRDNSIYVYGAKIQHSVYCESCGYTHTVLGNYNEK